MSGSLVTPLSLCFDSRLMDYEALESNRRHADSLLKTFYWKSTLPRDFPLIVCLVGGTGTGKSTVFNSLAGRQISEVGVRRPCTNKAILLVHVDIVPQLDDLTGREQHGWDEISIFPHNLAELKHLILVDTPDFDSVDQANRLIADSFFVISDILIVITSQEKYGDLLSRDLTRRAAAWGKDVIFLMNKVVSNEAYDDYRRSFQNAGKESEPIRVKRMDPSPEYIEGLRDRSHFSELFNNRAPKGELEKIRSDECKRLLSQTTSTLLDLENSIRGQEQRIVSTNSRIDNILASVSRDMENRLEVILSDELETQIKNRLEGFLRKYDILFVPRMMIRKAVGTVVREIKDFFVSGEGSWPNAYQKKAILIQDVHPALAAVRLQPLEEAIAKFNLRAVEFLSSAPALADLCKVARESVPRWNSEEIRSLYERSFPGVEALVEAEVDRFRHGLSTVDEIKLYGSYTLWALLIVTVEIAVGGGFSLLDALLNTVIVPFIPPWLIRLKLIDLLKEIGERVDSKHRDTMRKVLQEQSRLYKKRFRALLPDEEALSRLRGIRESLLSASRPQD